ncbi:MAG: hypothetical protein AAFY91_10580 [Bacteroidota bacterium]
MTVHEIYFRDGGRNYDRNGKRVNAATVAEVDLVDRHRQSVLCSLKPLTLFVGSLPDGLIAWVSRVDIDIA